uniref:Transmembrane protein n=1 Tax=Arundo donax TaxID=35708 RepID=A0A0A9HAN3_ARUDO
MLSVERSKSRFGLCRRSPENPRWFLRSIQRQASAGLRCPDGEMHGMRDRRAVVLFIPYTMFLMHFVCGVREALNCLFSGSFAPDGKKSPLNCLMTE